MQCWKFAMMFAGLWAVLAVLPSPSGQKKESKTPQKSETIRQLIENLDSKQFRVREDATKKLMAMDEEALPVMRQALKSSSLEVRQRLQRIMSAIHERQRQKQLVPLMGKGKRLPIDLLVERLVLKGKNAGLENRKAVRDLVMAMNAWASSISKKPLEDYCPLVRERIWCFEDARMTCGSGEHKWIIAEPIPPDSGIPSFWKSVIVSQVGLAERNETLSDPDFYESIVFSNGNIGQGQHFGGLISKSVLFCDGNVVADHVSFSVIIATGTVKCARCTDQNVILEKACNPLPFLKLFDLADYGVEVIKAPEGVRVKKLKEGSLLAKAGLLAEDRILALDQNKLETPEQFRKVLRAKIAAGGQGVVAFQRKGKAMSTSLQFPDWPLGKRKGEEDECQR